MFYYQEIKNDNISSNLGYKAQTSNNKKKLVITTGEDEVCRIYFIFIFKECFLKLIFFYSH